MNYKLAAINLGRGVVYKMQVFLMILCFLQFWELVKKDCQKNTGKRGLKQSIAITNESGYILLKELMMNGTRSCDP